MGSDNKDQELIKCLGYELNELMKDEAINMKTIIGHEIDVQRELVVVRYIREINSGIEIIKGYNDYTSISLIKENFVRPK